ncbi:hypothetical protein J7E81_17345 [Bacillus sp. ISL-18]|uniref:hypothetical protein n=1 Tax=Bacillus sp. ISL-18 TaxID=2819118 RepID=UPI001BE52F2E|nr:hypothetical protein [Bacillus sp. ISL-18]MBT2656986.1 hypothetical protein [Bacillus sp. ISL-18]
MKGSPLVTLLYCVFICMVPIFILRYLLFDEKPLGNNMDALAKKAEVSCYKVKQVRSWTELWTWQFQIDGVVSEVG